MNRYFPLTLLVLLPRCNLDQAESGDICVYTARSREQVYTEISSFVEAHPGIRLRCPTLHAETATEENLLCVNANGNEAKGADCVGEPRWELYRESTGALTDTIAAQNRHGLAADVVWGLAVTHTQHLDNLDNHIFVRYSPVDTYRVDGRLEDEGTTRGTFWSWFLDDTYRTRAMDHPRWVGVDAFAVVLCVNKSKLNALRALTPEEAADLANRGLEPISPIGDADPVITWDNLLDPRLHRGIAAPQANLSGTGFAQVVSELHPDYLPCYPGNMEGCDSWEYLDKLHEQIAIYTSSGDLPCQLAAQKNNGIALGITHDGAEFFKHDDGIDETTYDDVIRVFPTRNGKVSTGFDVAVSALIHHPTIKPAAQTFLDWASSQDAMELYAISTPLTAYDPDGKEVSPELDQVRNLLLDLDTAARKLTQLKSSWTDRYCKTKPEKADIPGPLQAKLDDLGLDGLDIEHRCAIYATPSEAP